MGSAAGKYEEPRSGTRETNLTRRDLLALSALGLVAGAPGVTPGGANRGSQT